MTVSETMCEYSSINSGHQSNLLTSGPEDFCCDEIRLEWHASADKTTNNKSHVCRLWSLLLLLLPLTHNFPRKKLKIFTASRFVYTRKTFHPHRLFRIVVRECQVRMKNCRLIVDRSNLRANKSVARAQFAVLSTPRAELDANRYGIRGGRVTLSTPVNHRDDKLIFCFCSSSRFDSTSWADMEPRSTRDGGFVLAPGLFESEIPLRGWSPRVHSRSRWTWQVLGEWSTTHSLPRWIVIASDCCRCNVRRCDCHHRPPTMAHDWLGRDDRALR